MRSLTVLVSGMLAGTPWQGGATWSVLQYVLGLQRLGHRVVVVEPVGRLEADVAEYFDLVVRGFGMSEAALVGREGDEVVGMPHGELVAIARSADLLLNISGMLDGEIFEAVHGTRVFLDLDPAFNQLWHAVEGVDMGFDRHDAFVTVGLALGREGCSVPTCGREWIPTLQPVVLDRWPARPLRPAGPITTIGNLRGYGSVDWRGVRYGQKVHSLRRLFPLPERVDRRIVLAMSVHPDERDDLAALHRYGWQLTDPRAAAGTPDAYAAFLAGSAVELGIAKSGYVDSRCGWFSDRSACYLASGRPVVAQDTGFGRALPVGQGLLSFVDVDGAASALDEALGDYEQHARAARTIAEDFFESDRVLTQLLSRVT